MGGQEVHFRTRDRVNQALAQLEAEYEQRAPKPFGASSAYQTPQRFGFIIQAGQAFTESFLTAIEKQRNGDRALEIEGLALPPMRRWLKRSKVGRADGWTCHSLQEHAADYRRTGHLRQAEKRVMALFGP